MTERQLEEKLAYNHMVSARARQKSKTTITTLEATVETQSKRLIELEQMNSVLFDQALRIAYEKCKMEQILLQSIASSDPQVLTNAGGGLPPKACAGNASLCTSNSDAHALLREVLERKAPGAVKATSAGTIHPGMIESTPAASFSVTRATTGSHQHQQLNDRLAAASLNALLVGNATNNISTSTTPHPPLRVPVIARPPLSTTNTMVHADCTHAMTRMQQQPGGAGLSPSHQTELITILQLLQMNSRKMGRNDMSA